MKKQKKQKISGIRKVFKMALAVSILYLLGFSFFIKSIPFNQISLDGEPKHDVIIVFTGEEDRIAEGLKLYKDGLAKNLFISGVFKEFPLQYFFALKNDINEFEDLDKTGIHYENFAKDTVDNIISVKLYLESRDYNDIIIVSSFYHIPRIKYLMSRFAREASVIYQPVFPQKLSRDILSKGFLKIALLEYNKILAYIFFEVAGIEDANLAGKK